MHLKYIAMAVVSLSLSTGLSTAVYAENTLVAEPELETKTLVWSDGTRYVGGVKDGKRWGKGTIFWQDGTRFVGHFAEDLRNGPGTMILPDGTVYKGIFENDSLVNNKPSSPASSKLANKALAKKIETPVGTPTLSTATRSEVQSMVNLWASAWSDKNVAQYLGHYSADFKVPGAQTRVQWEKLRSKRLSKPKSINVSVVYEKFQLLKPNLISVRINQTYRSDIYQDVTRKQLTLKKEGEFWRILSEQSI